jgi:hypothetical protein
MKNIFILFIIFCSCNAISKDATESFIPGTYVRSSQHEFGTEHDTLIISLQNENAHQYKIERRWLYERVLDGTKLDPEYKQISSSAVYNKEHKLLEEPATGSEYSFDVNKKTLFAGTTEYKKIN